MSDEPTLPNFSAAKAAATVLAAAVSGDAASGTGSASGSGSGRKPPPLRTNKRRLRQEQFGEHARAPSPQFSNSSDPAVFSSDDDPGLDNYLPGQRKKKRLYVGTWYEQQPVSSDPPVGPFDDDNSDTNSIAAAARTSGGGSGSGSGLRLTAGAQLTAAAFATSSHRRYGPPSSSSSSSVSSRSSSIGSFEMPPPPLPSDKVRHFLGRQQQPDSGVWMGRGDGQEGFAGGGGIHMEDVGMDVDGLPPSPSVMRTPTQASVTRFSHGGAAAGSCSTTPCYMVTPRAGPPRSFRRVSSMAANRAEEKAREIIQACIEQGIEEISLISMGIDVLSNATIEPLSRLEPIPVVTKDVAFEQRDPRLELFLSSNCIERLPGALFDLQFLTVLSLRSNDLEELPPAIGRLTNLKTLNISLNSLRYLPAELLSILPTTGAHKGQLAELFVQPNPFLVPSELAADSHASTAIPARPVGRPPTVVARTPVRYMDSTGLTWSTFDMQPRSGSIVKGDREAHLMDTANLYEPSIPPPLQRRFRSSDSSAYMMTAPHQAPPAASRVPTLVELAMRACYRSTHLDELADLLPPEAPAYMRRHLVRAQAQAETGGICCSVCGNKGPIVTPMTEWIEWLEFAKADLNVSYRDTKIRVTSRGSDDSENVLVDDVEVLPFRFRGCSWGCVPKPLVQRERPT